MNAEVKEIIEGKTGVKIDGKVSVADVLAVIDLVKPLLETPEAKEMIKGMLDHIEKHIKDSRNKIDDLIGLPALSILRRALGV